MAKEESMNQLNLTVVALVALVAIVGLVALVMNASSIKNAPKLATGSQIASAQSSLEQEIAQTESGNVVGNAPCRKTINNRALPGSDGQEVCESITYSCMSGSLTRGC